MTDSESQVTAQSSILSGLVSDPISRILSPDWSSRESFGDWRNYISEPLIEVWLKLSDESRIAAYVVAKDQASRELWDE